MERSAHSEAESSPAASLAAALASVGDRWTLLVVAALLAGPRRFGELQSELPGIAPNILSARLRRLEEQGLILSEAYQQRPARFVYEATAPGRELAGALRLLSGWGAQHSGADEPARHAVCGSPLEARLWCPSCERPVEDDEADELDYA